MLILFQERIKGSNVYFQRSMLSREERAGRLKLDWYDGRLITAIKDKYSAYREHCILKGAYKRFYKGER